MSILSSIKRKWKKAGEKAEDLSWNRSYAKKILPSRIEIFDTNLLFNQRTAVRCLVCGTQMETGSEGYPRDFSRVRQLKRFKLYLPGGKNIHVFWFDPNTRRQDKTELTAC